MGMLLALFLIGLITGALSGLFGVGGGFILVPLLTLVDIPIKEAIALSLVYIIGTAISGLFRHFKQNTVDVVLALSMAITSVFTAQLGANLTVGLPANTLKLYFGILTATVAVFYFFQPGPKTDKETATSEQNHKKPVTNSILAKIYLQRHKIVAREDYSYRLNLLIGLVIGAIVGFVSGMFGVGGGFLMVPLMTALMGVPLKIAVGTSLLGVLAPAISGSFALSQADKLDLHLLPALLVGGLLGAQVGARLLLLIKGTTLKLAFDALLLLVSCYMLALGTGFVQ